MADYMGKKEVTEDVFSRAIKILESRGAQKRTTTIGDPPTAIWEIDGEIQAQYFVPWMNDDAEYYLHPDILKEING